MHAERKLTIAKVRKMSKMGEREREMRASSYETSVRGIKGAAQEHSQERRQHCMMTDGGHTCGEYPTHREVDSLCCPSETNVTLC